MTDLSIGIVTYNNKDTIEKMLDSLLDNLPDGLNCDITAADNCSADGTLTLLERYSDRINVVSTGSNLGFGKGNNVIINQADSKYHVVLNPDIYIQDDVLLKLYNFMENSPDVVMATPCVRYEDGRLQHHGKRDPNFLDLFIRLFMPQRFKTRQRRYQMMEKDFSRVFDVEVASGSFLFARADVLKSIGGFDPRFFMYFEDSDLSRRMRRLGRVVYFPDGYVLHGWNRHSRRSIKMMLVMVISAMKYFRKWSFGGQS